jgi:hypothetical protein
VNGSHPFKILYPLLALLVAACASSPPQQGLAAAADSCPRSYEEALERGMIGLERGEVRGAVRLVRNPETGAPDYAVHNLAVRRGSDYWVTRCAVFLGEPAEPARECACPRETIFDRNSRLTVSRAGNGTFHMRIDDSRRGTITARLQPVAHPRGSLETAWLAGTDNSTEDIDFYVYLQDARNERFPNGYKAYRVDAFPKRAEAACEAHRPQRAVCLPGDPRPACHLPRPTPDRGEAGVTVEVCAMQTDTGGGHEGPP